MATNVPADNWGGNRPGLQEKWINLLSNAPRTVNGQGNFLLIKRVEMIPNGISQTFNTNEEVELIFDENRKLTITPGIPVLTEYNKINIVNSRNANNYVLYRALVVVGFGEVKDFKPELPDTMLTATITVPATGDASMLNAFPADFPPDAIKEIRLLIPLGEPNGLSVYATDTTGGGSGFWLEENTVEKMSFRGGLTFENAGASPVDITVALICW